METTHSNSEKRAKDFLEILYYTICESYFQRIVQVTQLDKDLEKAVRMIVLRPGDFKVAVEGEPEEKEVGSGDSA
jgi:hypothetical protein